MNQLKLRTTKTGMVVAGVIFCLGSAAIADEPDLYTSLEILPQHLDARVNRKVLPDRIAAIVPFSVFEQSKLWRPGSTLRVCFVGGSPDLQSQIADAAIEWSKWGNIVFDFGQIGEGGPCRTCVIDDQSEIRISFSYNGYWSLVGNDSVDWSIAGPGEATMNYARFDVNPPPSRFLRAVVLHEFGHALGFHHEHQSPQGSCDAEFNWPQIYERLKGPPNYWDRQKIDRNLRQLPNSSAFSTSAHDPKSIMHYSFPAWMCLRQPSPCCVEENVELSDEDKTGMNKAYPPNADQVIKTRTENLLKVLNNPELPYESRLLFQQKLNVQVTALDAK